ncbi:hypothetical protein HBB16_12435 [Pseudonocardia sp. MCCB 268]|nr:hypothetical protein [Pseudonocardia cytotoxica]
MTRSPGARPPAGRRADGDTATTAFHLMLLARSRGARRRAEALTFAHESETLCAQVGERRGRRSYAPWVRALAHCTAGEYERTIEAVAAAWP